MPGGAVNIGDIEARLKLNDELTARLSTAVRDIQRRMGDIEQSTKKAKSGFDALAASIQSVGAKMSDVGTKLSTHVTLPLLAVGAAAAKASIDFNEGMANIATLIPGNIDRVRELKTSVQDLAVDVGKRTSDLTGGLYQTISAFGDTSDSVKILEINARAATAGLAQTEQAINLTSGVTKAYGDTTATAVEKAADLALMTVRLGQTTFPELADAMGRVTPIAQAMRQSQEDLFAVFATGTGVTGKAAEVATQYRGVLAALLDPSETLAKLIKKMGFESGKALLAQHGLIDSLTLIVQSAEKSKRPITDYIAQIEAIPLALALAGPQASTFKTKLEEMRKAAGTTTVAFEEQTKGINKEGFALEQLKSKIEVTAQRLGDALVPSLLRTLDALTPLIEFTERLVAKFAALPSPIRHTVVVILSIAAAAGPVVLVIGKTVEAFGALVAIAPKVASAARVIASSLAGLPTIIAAIGLAVNRMVTEWKQGMDQVIREMTRFQGEAAKYLDTEARLRKAQKLGFVDVSDLQSATESIGAIADDIKELQERWVETRRKLSEEHNYWTKKDLETESEFIASEIKLQIERRDRLQKLLNTVGGLPHPVNIDTLLPPTPPLPSAPVIGIDDDTIDRYGKLIKSLHLQARGVREVIKAYEDGTVAGERVAEKIDRQADAAQQASDFTGSYKDNIELAVLALGELQAHLEGVIRASALKQRIDDTASLSDSKSLVDLARIRGELEKQARVREAVGTATGEQAKKLKELAEQSFDDEQRLAVHELQIGYEATNKALEDWITTYVKGVSAVDSLTREQESEAEVTQHLLALHGVMPDKLDKEIRKRLELNRAVQALRDISALTGEANFAVRVSGLDIGTRLGRLEEQYLSFARNIGQGSVEVGERVIQDLSDRFFALTGIFVDFADQIRVSLAQIDDAQTVSRIRESVKSPLDMYREERANIERLMQSSVDSVRISTEEGLAYINRITEEFWSGQISNWSAVINTLADTFGGVFESLAQGAKIIEDAYNTYTLIKNAVTSAGGSENWGQTFGEIGAWLQIVKGIYDVWKGHKARREGRVFENDQPVVTMRGGMWNDGPLSDGWAGTFTAQLSQRSYEISRKIQQAADSFAESIGGTLASFADLEIKIRRDGKKIRAFVAGAFLGEFNDIEEAISAALAAAFADPRTTFRGLTELVQQALNQVTSVAGVGGLGGSAEALQDWLVQIKEVAQIQWSQAAVGTGEAVRHLESLWQQLVRVRDVTPAVVQGFADLGMGIVRSFQDWADSISGRQRTDAEILAEKQRDRDLFIAQRALKIAEFELRKLELQQLRAGVQSRANIDAAGGRLEQIRIQWRTELIEQESELLRYEAGLQDASIRSGWAYTTAKAELVSAEVSLTQQYTDIVAAQIAAIDAILAGLAAIPIPEIGLGRGAGSGGRNLADERRDFREQLRDIVASALPDIESEFYSLQQRIRDLQEEARRLKIPIGELAPALAALRREFQEGLLARANDLAGIGTGFTARLQEGLDFFDSLARLGRLETGIPDWLREILEGRFLEQMRADWQSRVDSFRGIENPMLEIQARAAELSQDLLALAAATNMSADQIAAAQAQIAEGIEFQRLSAVNGILDRIFGYLRESEEYAADALAFDRAKIELEFRLMEAQLRFLNAWDETTAAWLAAAREIALEQLIAPVEEITTAASSLTDAANAQKSLADRWKSAIESWKQYQESLRTDASLGMVNSREALNNARSLYESLRDRALGGDVEAAERLSQAAEDYRRNLIAFSPSSELVSSVLRGMDALNLDNLAPRVDPVVSGLTSIYTAINTQTTDWANHFATQTANDNTWTNHIADTTATHLTLVQDKQQRTTDEIVGLRGEVRDLNSNILAWRGEAREASGKLLGVEGEIRDETQRMVSNMARVLPLAATPK